LDSIDTGIDLFGWDFKEIMVLGNDALAGATGGSVSNSLRNDVGLGSLWVASTRFTGLTGEERVSIILSQKVPMHHTHIHCRNDLEDSCLHESFKHLIRSITRRKEKRYAIYGKRQSDDTGSYTQNFIHNSSVPSQLGNNFTISEFRKRFFVGPRMQSLF
jgi:hypothetical protein